MRFMVCALTALLQLGSLLVTVSSGEVYHHLDGTVTIVPSNERITIQHDSTTFPPGAYDFRSIHASISDTGEVLPLDRGFFSYPLADGYDFDAANAELNQDPYLSRILPVYLMPDGTTELGVTDMVSIQFEDYITADSALSLLAGFGLEFVDSSKYRHNYWWAALCDTIPGSPLPVANAIEAEDATVWATPSFHIAMPHASLPGDNYFSNQFYLRDTIADADIDADSAWLFVLPMPHILVAVLDDGVKSHMDIPLSRLYYGHDFYYGDSVSEPGRFQNHGMACAGILGAARNDTGIVGVHPDCLIVPLDKDNNPSQALFGANAPSDSIAQAFYYAYAKGVSVISNSWAGRSPYPVTSIQSAIRYVTQCSSDTNGMVVVFAVHNWGIDTIPFPANMDEVIAVGAIDRYNEHFAYSNTGWELDVVAPSGQAGLAAGPGVWAVDQNTNDSGWNSSQIISPDPSDANGDRDYTFRMGGTSAACPQVAGIAALILSRSPHLRSCTTGTTVRRIIAESADDLGVAGPDSVYGYGRANAYLALVAVSHGDFDGNGVYDVLDVAAIRNEAFWGAPPSAIHPALSDVNCDGVTDVFDVIGIINIAFYGHDLPSPCFEF